MCPTLGINYRGFTTRFESRGAHGCKKQWYTWDMRV
jgi:hypothetical protein